LRNIQSQCQSTQTQCQNIQNQYQTVQNQLANLTDMMSKFMSSNMASSSGSGTLSAHVQPPVTQSETPVSEPIVAPVSAPMPNLKPSIPYPSRHDDKRRREQANEQIEKFYEIFKDMSFEISFTDALILMPKFASTLKALIGNKEKLSEMARTPMNEHCSAIILNKLPKKLGDPGKFLIPCEFLGMDECHALADLADFVVVDFEPDPRVPLILRRCFLKTGRALIDVHKGELTLRIGNEAITYNLDQTSRYSANYDQMTANKIDVTDEACEEYFQEVLGFSNVTASGSPTPSDDPIVSPTSPTLTPFGDSDFLLFEEANAFLAILNSDPVPSLPNHEQSVPSFTNELKACEAKTIKSSIDEPPEVELKDLPPHLEYTFLEGDNKLHVIIAKELGEEEKAALIKVLKSHKRAIAWKLSDIQGINLEFCTHKILMEEDYKPAVQH
nr:reverse transcriptase domain-containing protein [Tanacetum cinerariifolium]